MPKMEGMGDFLAQNERTLYWVCLKLNLIAGIKKWTKVTLLDLDGKFLLCSKWGKWVKS